MNRASIMIVEDEFIIQHQLKLILEGLEYQVIAMASEAEEAIRMAEKCNPDLILMDIKLSGDLDGIDAATEIKKRMGIPIIFTTAFTDDERIERAKLNMPYGYLIKPVQERELKITIEMALYAAKIDAERIQAEKALLKSENKYRNLVDFLPTAMFEIDEKGAVLFANSFFMELFGYTEADLNKGFNIFQTVAPEDRDRAISTSKQVMKGKGFGGTKYTGITKKGKRFPVIAHSSRVSYDTKTIQLGILIDNTVRIQTEKALQQSEKKYRQIFENILTPYYESSIEGTLLELSPSVERYLKYSREELIGTQIQKLYADSEQRDRFIKKLLEKGELYDEEILIRDKDGSILTALMNAKYIPEDSKIVGSLLDVTERKTAETALAESEELFRTTVNAMNEGLIVTDIDFKPIYVNPKVYDLTGYDKSDLKTITFENFYTEESQSKLMEAFTNNMETGKGSAIEVQVIKKDGKIADFLFSGNIVMKDKKFQKTVATYTDLSEIKQAEEKQKNTIVQLQDALATIKKLSGLVPICANCKKIRDDKGYWNQIESYIEKHSEALFSHSICPDCAEELYGDQEWYKRRKRKET